MTLVSPLFARFIANGLLVSSIDVGLTHILDYLTQNALFAVTTGFVAGLTTSYILHAKVTFAVPLAPARQMPRLLITVAINYLLTITIVWSASTALGASTTAGKLLSLPFVALMSYLLCRRWVYKS